MKHDENGMSDIKIDPSLDDAEFEIWRTKPREVAGILAATALERDRANEEPVAVIVRKAS